MTLDAPTSDANDLSPLLGSGDVAALIDCDVQSLRAAQRNQTPGYPMAALKVGHRYRWRASDLARFMHPAAGNDQDA